MRVDGAGFATSLDADTEGEEGKYYTWTEAELDTALQGTMIPRFKQVYGVSTEGNFHGRNVLHRYIPVPNLSQADENLFATQRKKLLAVRETREKPFRDDKVLADWNGMMIAALSFAGPVMQHPEWTDAAEKAFAYVCEKLGDGDRLFHTYRAGKRQHAGFSDDYANMALAALMLFEATQNRSYLERAIAWTRVLDEDYWNIAQGGYAFSPNRNEPVEIKIRTALDTQTPAANGLMLEVLARLYYLTGEQAYGDRITALANAFSGDVNGAYLQMATFLNGIEFCANAVQVVIIGPNTDTRTHDLINAVLGRSIPNRLLTIIAPDAILPATHPAHGKAMQNGQPTAYICRGNICSSPVTSAVTLSQALQMPNTNQGAVQAAIAPRRGR